MFKTCPVYGAGTVIHLATATRLQGTLEKFSCTAAFSTRLLTCGEAPLRFR